MHDKNYIAVEPCVEARRLNRAQKIRGGSLEYNWEVGRARMVRLGELILRRGR
jgi:hypothetical protein